MGECVKIGLIFKSALLDQNIINKMLKIFMEQGKTSITNGRVSSSA